MKKNLKYYLELKKEILSKAEILPPPEFYLENQRKAREITKENFGKVFKKQNDCLKGIIELLLDKRFILSGTNASTFYFSYPNSSVDEKFSYPYDAEGKKSARITHCHVVLSYDTHGLDKEKKKKLLDESFDFKEAIELRGRKYHSADKEAYSLYLPVYLEIDGELYRGKKQRKKIFKDMLQTAKTEWGKHC